MTTNPYTNPYAPPVVGVDLRLPFLPEGTGLDWFEALQARCDAAREQWMRSRDDWHLNQAAVSPLLRGKIAGELTVALGELLAALRETANTVRSRAGELEAFAAARENLGQHVEVDLDEFNERIAAREAGRGVRKLLTRLAAGDLDEMVNAAEALQPTPVADDEPTAA